MTNMTKEQYAEVMERVRKDERKEKIIAGVISRLKVIIFIPLSIGFSVIGFVARLVGSIVSLGIIFGIYKLFCVIGQMKTGVPFTEATGAFEVIFFVVLPFVIFGIAELADVISKYLKYCAY